MMSLNGNETKCLKCNLNFTSAKTLERHQQEKHAQNVVKCFKCNLKFLNQERFRAHWNSRHANVTKNVLKPKSATNEETIVLDEEDNDCNTKTSKPPRSPKSPTSPRSPKTKNVRRCGSPTSNRCTKCYKTFSSRMTAQLHYRRVHMDWTTKCEVCQKGVKKNIYFRHLAKHRSNDEISIERILEIQKGNKKKKSWSGDINVKVTPNEPTACSDCTKIFISERMMKIHWNRIHYDSNKPEADQPKSTKIVSITEETPASCPKCDKEFISSARMKIHYFQAHVKQKRKPAVQQEAVAHKEAEATSFPTIKSLSDLRSNTPAITFTSNKCPACKKIFASNAKAINHFKVVHRKEKSAKCPYPQCFSRFSTRDNLRFHFSRAHPKAILPEEFQIRRPKRRKVDTEESANEEEIEKEANFTPTKTVNEYVSKNTTDDHQTPNQKENVNKNGSNKNTPKANNPLLKMFEKMREKNATSPVAPSKSVSEVNDIEEDQHEEESGGCFTLDFDKCSMCKRDFVTREAAQMHYQQIHPNEMQMCPECEMLLSNARVLPYHYKSKHPNIVLPIYLKSVRAIGYAKELFNQFNMHMCTICKLEFTTKSKSLQHFNDEHAIKFEICSVCQRGFRTEALLLSHWARIHDHLKFIEFKEKSPMQIDEESQNERNSNSAANSRSSTPTSNSNSKATSPVTSKHNTKYGHQKIYPFIVAITCPVCNRNFSTRKTTVTHYKIVHCKNGIKCQVCSTVLANREHLKEHWLTLHEDVPWNDKEDSTNDKENFTRKNASKDQEDSTKDKKNSSKEKDVSTEISNEEMQIDINNDDVVDAAVDSGRKEPTTSEKTPKLVAVSLYDLQDNPHLLSPKMRSHFFRIVEEMKNAGGVSNAVRETNTVCDNNDESQDQPLDLSLPHKTDDSLDQSMIKCEPIDIKYESSANMVTSFEDTFSTHRRRINSLSDGTSVIVKEELTFEESKLDES